VHLLSLIDSVTNKKANVIEKTKADAQRIVKWSESVKAVEFTV